MIARTRQKKPKQCSVKGCKRANYCKGLCGLHYSRLRSTGTTEPRPKKICSVEGCTRPHHSKGLCGIHYRRLRYAGTTDPRPKTVCSLEGCEGKHVARGFCRRHYDQLIRAKRQQLLVSTQKLDLTPTPARTGQRQDSAQRPVSRDRVMTRRR
ncbi:MAG: hypothetical protein OES79_02020 [Planctomycetota bacterium]|nr:hypothetical protein [Planctomycetota bacterium]